MKKHEKKRLQGIKLQQKIAKAKKRVSALFEEGAVRDQETLVNAVYKLSSRDLKVISNHPERFSGYGYSDTNGLSTLCQSVLAERVFKLSQ